jgi:hypothetical protein
VLFELDGDFYNQRYPGKAVDYWNNRDPMKDHHKAHEAEDRIFSRENAIPAAIRVIDLYIAPDADEAARARTRQVIILAKKAGIPVNLFNDQAAWRQRDTRKLADVSQLRGQDPARGYVERRRGGYLKPWMELMQAKTKAQLSKAADSKRYALQYTYDKQEMTKSLSVDLSNARKPGPDADRNNAIRIIKFMQQNRLTTVDDFVNFLADKWKNIKEGVAEGTGFDQEAGIGLDGESFKFKIKDLVALANKYPVTPIDPQQFTQQIKGRNEDPTQSMARAEKADLQYPIIVVQRKNGKLWIADGTHRAHKAILNKIPKINAKIIPIKDMSSFSVKQGVSEGVMSDLDQDRQDANWDAIVGYVINGLKKNQDVGHMELALYKWGGKELVDVDQELEDRGFGDLADLADHIQQHGGRYQPPTNFGLDEDRNPVYQLPELTLILDPHFIERMGTRQLNSRVVAQLMSRLKSLTQKLSQFEPGQKIWVNSPSLKVKLGMRRQMDRNGKMTYLLKTVVKNPTWDNPDPTITVENFADGKKPGRKGLAKRVGVDCKQPVSKLRSVAKNSSGERQRMAHWCANMKSGRK